MNARGFISAQLLIVSITCGTVALVSYHAGANSVKAEYNGAITRMAESHRVQQEALDDYISKYEAERAKKQAVQTRTVERVRREIVKLPARDCGWTPDEWVQLSNAYCAAFPDVPDCLHEGLLRSTTDVPAEGRSVSKGARDSADDGPRDLSGREESLQGTAGETP